MALNICGINITKQELLQQRDSIIQLIKTEIENIEDDSEREELLEIFSEIHETFITILVPIMYKDLNLPLYSSTIRLHLKDKGPAIFGYLQKILLSVANTRDEIKRVLDFIDLKQQEVIDLKKAENSILSFNSALNSKRSENLENNEQIADLYIKWKEETDANWSKNKWKLLFNNNPQDELDQLAVLDRFIDFE
jgi:FtsZ-binding cell division protein ZapB